MVKEKIADIFLDKEDIRQDEYEIYMFGINQIISFAINVFTIMVLGFIFQEMMQAIIYFAAFMILHSYSGGYHASKSVGCYILTTVTNIIALITIKYVTPDISVFISMGIMTGIIILIMSPVDTANKTLDIIEISCYRRRTLYVYIAEIIIVLICLVAGLPDIAKSIIYAHCILAISILAGSIVKKSSSKL